MHIIQYTLWIITDFEIHHVLSAMISSGSDERADNPMDVSPG